jgi:four helix bundle protein
MSRTDFQRLRVYRLAEQLADEVWGVVAEWEAFAKRTVGQQLTRCVDSIGANIAEGAGRGSYRDNRRFVRIARGSLYEAQHWLRRAYKRQLLSAGAVASISEKVKDLAPTLNAYLRSIGSSKPAPTKPID